MRAFSGVREALRLVLFRWREDREMDDELEFHVEMATERNMGLGMDAAEARRQAVIALGGVERHREELREGRRFGRIENVWRDLRFAGRSLGRTPAMTAVVVLVLGLGVGICTAMYSVARAVVLDEVPFPEPERLFSIELSGQGSFNWIPLHDHFLIWKEEAAGTAELAAWDFATASIGTGERAIDAYAVGVSEGFFSVVRPRAMAGRTLGPADMDPASVPGAVLSRRLWQDIFGGDPEALGRTVYIGGREHVVVGILERGQEFPAPMDAWVPLSPPSPELAERRVSVIGRLAGGAAFTGLERTLEGVHQSLMMDRPEAERSSRIVRLPLTGVPNEMMGIGLFLLGVCVGSILLIGIANAAALVLVRSYARTHEIAIRSSLGANRRRIVGQLVTEGALIGMAAGVVGTGIAFVAIRAFRAGMPADVTRQMLGWEQLGLNAAVLAFAAGLALIAGVGATLFPAIAASRPGLSSVLAQSSSRAGESRGRSRVFGALVAAEVAVSVAMLLSAGLLTRSVLERIGGELGFESENVVTIPWRLPEAARDSAEAMLALQRGLIEAVGRSPEIASVAATSGLPAMPPGFRGGSRTYRVPADPPDSEGWRAASRTITPGYLETLGIPVMQGRSLEPADAAAAPRVAVVSESLARRHWGAESAVGRFLLIDNESWTVVGVAGDTRNPGAGPVPEATIYVPQAQAPSFNGVLVARTFAAPGGDTFRRLREEMWRTDPRIALGEASTLDSAIADLVADQWVMAVMVLTYAAVALLITLISVYTVVAYFAVRHRREHGIRLALGASPARLVREAMSRGLRGTLVGLAAGLVLAIGVARLISGLLYGIQPLDPSVFGTLPLLLLFLFLIAVYLPARRAAKGDPAVVLRA